MNIYQLETPVLVVDKAIFEKNLNKKNITTWIIKYITPIQITGHDKNCFEGVLFFENINDITISSTQNMTTVNPYATQNINVLLDGITKAKTLNKTNKIVNIIYGVKLFFIRYPLSLFHI